MSCYTPQHKIICLAIPPQHRKICRAIPSQPRIIFRAIPPQLGCPAKLVLLQNKQKPKLVLALSETKCLFRLFLFFAETASFGVSFEPKQKNFRFRGFSWPHLLCYQSEIFTACRSHRFLQSVKISHR